MKLFKFILIISWTISWAKELCKNGANNYPECNNCPEGKIFIANQCAVTVTPPNQEVWIKEPVENNPVDTSNDRKCPQGKIFIEGQCAVYGVPEEGGK